MKKVLLLIMLLLIPLGVKADVVPYDLVEICEANNIEIDSSLYKESKEKVNIYLFMLNTCPHCHNLLKYLVSILPDNGKYFNVVVYEVSNVENSMLMDKVTAKFDLNINSVPFYVIGDQYFSGYNADMNKDILNKIIKEYIKEIKYDIMKELDTVDDTSSEPFLTNIKINNQTINDFNSHKYIYSYEVDSNVNRIDIEAIPNNDLYNVIINNVDELLPGNNNITINVIDGNIYKTYTINVYKKTNDNITNESNNVNIVSYIEIGIIIIAVIGLFIFKNKKNM